jgi:hypothetical protein
MGLGRRRLARVHAFGSASQAAAAQDSSMRMVGLRLEVLSCALGLSETASVIEIGPPDHTQRIREVQILTIIRMLVEVVACGCH